jgi:hypothetical protein
MHKRLIMIVAAASAVPLVAACSAAGGHQHRQHQHTTDLGLVTGKFERVGGPLQRNGKTLTVALPGTVTFTAAHGRPALVRVGKSGRFAVRLSPGSYRVSGESPLVEGFGGRSASCSLQLTITVSAGHSQQIKVICAVP